MSQPGFDSAVEAYREALAAFVTGDPRPVERLYSRSDDVTLANPLGPLRRGWADVEQAIEEAAANFESGTVRFEEVSRDATPDLGYVVQLERFEVRLAGSTEVAPTSLRVTMIFRPEENTWKVVHRHADPITSVRSVSTMMEA